MTKEDEEIIKKIKLSGIAVEELVERMNNVDRILKANQPLIDGFATGEPRTTSFNNKSFGSVWTQETGNIWKTKEAEIRNFQTDKNAKLVFELKVADMRTDTHITGDSVMSYSQKVGLVPNHSVNFRDLIPTVKSPTGTYVGYRETGTTGSISVQTEGQLKTQIDYTFTEVRTVSNFIAGFAVFSKQMMYHLPFLQNTLPRMLLRDFYKKENDYFYGALYLAAEGNAVAPAEATNDAEELLHWTGNQRDADFNASFWLVSWSDWVHLLKTGRNANSGYGVPGGIIFSNDGSMTIAGVPVIPASWVDAGNPLLVDREMVERVETESLRVEFSYEDSDNFRKNLVTARVECFEDLHIIRPDAHIGAEFGGS